MARMKTETTARENFVDDESAKSTTRRMVKMKRMILSSFQEDVVIDEDNEMVCGQLLEGFAVRMVRPELFPHVTSA